MTELNAQTASAYVMAGYREAGRTRGLKVVDAAMTTRDGEPIAKVIVASTGRRHRVNIVWCVALRDGELTGWC